MRFETENLKDNVLRIHGFLAKEDYQGLYHDKIKELRTRGSFKGFRQGKAPSSFVEKMYGTSTLSEVVNDKLVRGLYEYIEEQNINALVDPMIAEGQGKWDLDPRNMEDMTIAYDVVLQPRIELSVLDKVYTVYQVDVDDKTVDYEIVNIRKRIGKLVNVDDKIEDNDILDFTLFEIDENGNPVDGGMENHSQLYLNDATEEFKSTVLGQSSGFTAEVSPYELESKLTPAQVNHYFLGKSNHDEKFEKQFKIIIDSVRRQDLADLDQELFDAYTGEKDKVSTLEEFRERVRKNISQYFDEQTDNLLKNEMIKDLRKETIVELPEEEILNWSRIRFGNEAQPPTPEELLSDLKWKAILDHIVKKYDIEVTSEEINEKATMNFYDLAMQYGIPPQQIQGMVQNYLSKKENTNRIYLDIETQKMMQALRNEAKVSEKVISIDEFNDLVKEYKQEQANGSL